MDGAKTPLRPGQRRPSWRAIKDPKYDGPERAEEEVTNQDAYVEQVAPIQVGFNLILVILLPIALAPPVLVTLLYSEMGFGALLHKTMEKQSGAASKAGGVLVCFVVVLYCLDFYLPPHINKRCTFFERTAGLPACVFAIKAILLFTYGLLDIAGNPMITILLTAGMGPVAIVGMWNTFVRESMTPADVDSLTSTGHCGTVDGQIRSSIWKAYTGDMRQSRVFWAAGMCALIITGWLTCGVWFAWMLSRGGHLRNIMHSTQNGGAYMRWIAPGVAGFANIGFGLCMGVRVHVAGVYEKAVKEVVSMTIIANEFRAKLGATTFSADLAEFEDMLKYEQAKVATGQSRTSRGKSSAEKMSYLEEKWVKSQHQQRRFVAHISQTFKVAAGVLVFLGGSMNVYTAMVTTNADFVSSFQTILGFLFLNMCIVIFMSCDRLRGVAGDWLKGTPMVGMAMSAVSSTWAKAGFVCMFMPAIPMFFALSLINQFVRRRRKIYPRMSTAKIALNLKELRLRRRRETPELAQEAELEICPALADQWFTARVRHALSLSRKWDWVMILKQAYLLAFAFSMSSLAPRFINVILSWLISILNAMPYSMIMVATVGSTTFISCLPSAPTLPIYLFTGIILVAPCPLGFMPGCAIACTVAYLCSVFAGVICQKAIGGGLGRSKAIQQMVGVHKPLVRAIEIVLKQPGITVAKTAIASGGPGWATAVLSGLINCSAIGIQIATFPTVLIISPSALSGAFFLRKAESPEWEKYANLMLNLTAMATALPQLLAFWAIQDILENRAKEVTKPMMKYIDLDWMDYEADELANCHVVRWQHLNCCVKMLYIFGLILEVASAHMFYWMPSDCFGAFEVTDPIGSLVFLGKDGLLKWPAVGGVAAMSLGFICYFIVGKTVKRLRAPHVKKRKDQLQAYEPAWRAARTRLARMAERGEEWEAAPPALHLHDLSPE